MDTSNWINLGILLVTALAVVVTVRQASQAKTSAADAKRHEEAALAASVKSAEANERAAAALEDANALSRQASAKPRWQVTQLSDENYRVENQGPGPVHDVDVSILEHPSALVKTNDLPRAVLEEGLAFSFMRFRAFGMPSDPTLVITWTDPESQEQSEARVTL